MVNFDNLTADYMEESKVDYVGLWQIAASIEDDLATDDGEAIRSATMHIVRELVSRGLVPGDYTLAGFMPWEGSEDEKIGRIATEWDRLGTAIPTLDNTICWFALQTALKK